MSFKVGDEIVVLRPPPNEAFISAAQIQHWSQYIPDYPVRAHVEVVHRDMIGIVILRNGNETIHKFLVRYANEIFDHYTT